MEHANSSSAKPAAISTTGAPAKLSSVGGVWGWARCSAAGILQPVNCIDVGAQTSDKLKSLKVKRGDQQDAFRL